MKGRYNIVIEKISGEQEHFNEKKLHNSLARVGVNHSEACKIIDELVTTYPHKITTEEIYRFIQNKLKNLNQKSAIRYSLKKALLMFGPTGFPFEEYVAEIFRHMGYKCRVGAIINGKCIEHEVDVYAQKGGEKIAIEVKFHNKQKFKTDVKTSLYIKARFDDLLAKNNLFPNTVNKGILLTNSHFTVNAKKYVSCVKTFDLIGWDYPSKYALRDLIEDNRIHPITCLPSLTRSESEILFNHKIFICRDLIKEKDNLKHIGIPADKIPKLLDESQMLCDI